MVSHFDKFGNENKDEQLLNKEFISVTLSIFHLDILGKDNIDEHPSNN